MLEQVYSLLDALALSQLKHFHFLRPWWLCAIIPLALFYRYVVRVDDTLSPWKKVMSERSFNIFRNSTNKLVILHRENYFLFIVYLPFW